MIDSTVRTRFAPSPTGALHLGNARTAMFAWLYARGHGGAFILRSEDTDADRSGTDHLEQLIEALRWLGLDWDEGPDIDGPHAPYVQSGRLQRHRRILEELLDQDRAYPCFCTREELAQARRRREAAGEPPRYTGTCAALGERERTRQRESGRSAVIRLRVPEAGETGHDDLVHGHLRTAWRTIGDFVIAREDGSPVFLFANAVDDADMGISHVFRGEDHLSNTPRQRLLLEALRLGAPADGHLPLVLGAGGRPLAKRDGSASLADLRERGYRPEAIVNHLARIGFTPECDELLPLVDLAARFRLDHVGRAAAHHDPRALGHWQKLSVEALDDATAWHWIESGRPANAVELPVDGIAFTAAIRHNTLLPEDAWYWADRLFAPGSEPDADARAEIERAGPGFFRQALAVDSPSPAEDFRGWVKAVGGVTGARGRDLFRPLRAALTGALAGPELHAVVPLIPPNVVHERLRRAGGGN